MPVMGTQCATPGRKPTTELIAIITVGVTVLGQAAWLDGKIERLQEGQAELRERLAVIETRFANPGGLAQADTETLTGPDRSPPSASRSPASGN